MAESLDEFEDLIKTFTLLAGRPAGRGPGRHHQQRRLRMLDGDGPAWTAWNWRLSMPATQARLDEVLPAFAHRSNPIDCTPMTGTEAFCGQLPGHPGLPDSGCGHPVLGAGDPGPGQPAGRSRRASTGKTWPGPAPSPR